MPKPTKAKTEEPLEKTLWKSADKLRKNMDAAEYKHIVLGLIFLKYISDAFEELHAKLSAGEGEYEGADPEDADEYRAENVFFVPANARWSHLQARAKLPEIGKDVDEAMEIIEKENPTLKGVLPKQYARQNLDKASLGALIDMIATIGLGDAKAKSQDVLGRVYEYFLGEFAAAEGKKGGQFYTPVAIVKTLVAMLEPYKGRVYDPCCGSGGMFVQAEKLVEAHQGRIDDISIYGQESNQTTYRLCRMNLAIRGIDGSNVRWNGEGSFLNDAHKDMKAEFIIANPPFNDSDWSGELLRDDPRWQFGLPPAGNANFAWMQHMIYHLAPNGTLGLVLANGSLSSNSGGESEIRKAIVEAKLVDCIVALPDKLFYNTGIPACLWFISRDRNNGGLRPRADEILFIDARNLGEMITRRNRDFSDDDIARIAETYHQWRSKEGNYQDEKGFCKAAALDEVRKHNFVLTPGRYVGIPDEDDNDVPFDFQMRIYNQSLMEITGISRKVDEKIRFSLKKYFPALDWNDIDFSSSQILEAIAQTLFKRWFVEFEFPDENGQPYQSSGGAMQPSELGEIPVGWDVGTLRDISECYDSKRVPLSSSQRAKRQGQYPYYGATSVMDHIDDYLFDGVYLLLGEDGSVITESGKPFLQYVWGKIWVNNHAHVLQGKGAFTTEMLYIFLKNYDVSHIVTGAVQLKINQANLFSIESILPKSEVLMAFSGLIEPIFEKIRSNKTQIESLTKTRDTLLPKLMSGELRVSATTPSDSTP